MCKLCSPPNQTIQWYLVIKHIDCLWQVVGQPSACLTALICLSMLFSMGAIKSVLSKRGWVS